MKTKQFSFFVNNNKITIKARPRSSCGNFIGYLIEINKTKYKIFCLDMRNAIDKAYIRWVQENI